MNRREAAWALAGAAAGSVLTLVLVVAWCFPDRATGAGTVALVIVAAGAEGYRLWTRAED